MKVLVKEEIGHIKGYGRMSDGWSTRQGLDPIQHALFMKQGFRIIEEFEEDKSIPPHIVDTPEVPYTVIPKGTNRIYIVHPQLSEKV